MSTVVTPPPSAGAVVGAASAKAARVKKKSTSPLVSLVVVVIATIWTIPTFGLVLSSFRPENDIKQTGWWTAFSNPSFTLENYKEVLFGSSSNGQLANFFLNSVVITVPSVMFSLFFGALAAYALSWMNWKGRDWVFIAIFALQIVPLQMALVPLLRIFSTAWPFSLLDPQGTGKFLIIWIAHVCFGMPLVTFLLHNFMSDLPGELMEAARVDGADHARIFRSIVVPLIVPALASIGIFQFLYIWNDLLVGLVFGTSETKPLTAAVADLAGTRGQEWQRLTAGAFVSMVVPLLVFISLQRYFVRGLLAGGLKG
ncbi:carbohydrate ABC transporter permease [Kineosporia sp. R_H_3]|uniref:carbohydrate ABC transporter permease n=1 Tax=Kineosporia sp. R_H_3 TaxID=1961848 RepID=UPI000B4B1C82|nr:carbohydrate ABC transporter permease [Kineosporia sp. R_H_3]